MSSSDANHAAKAEEQKDQARTDAKDRAEVELTVQELEERIAPAKMM